MGIEPDIPNAEIIINKRNEIKAKKEINLVGKVGEVIPYLGYPKYLIYSLSKDI